MFLPHTHILCLKIHTSPECGILKPYTFKSLFAFNVWLISTHTYTVILNYFYFISTPCSKWFQNPQMIISYFAHHPMTILNPPRIVNGINIIFVYKLSGKFLNVKTVCMFPFKWYFNFVNAAWQAQKHANMQTSQW